MAAGAQARAARRDARRMRVGWAIVWRRTPLVYGYLWQVGFRYGYGAAGVNVYRLGRVAAAARRPTDGPARVAAVPPMAATGPRARP